MAVNEYKLNDTGYLMAHVLRLMDAWTLHTIASGVIDLTFGLVKLAAESGTADDLATINGAATGHIIVLKAQAGDVITVKHDTGNILCPDDVDFELDGDEGNILGLIYDYEDFDWKPLFATGLTFKEKLINSLVADGDVQDAIIELIRTLYPIATYSHDLSSSAVVTTFGLDNDKTYQINIYGTGYFNGGGSWADAFYFDNSNNPPVTLTAYTGGGLQINSADASPYPSFNTDEDGVYVLTITGVTSIATQIVDGSYGNNGGIIYIQIFEL